MPEKNKLLNRILNIDLIIAGIAFAALVFFTLLGVVMRYVVGAPLAWLEEVQVLCFLWMSTMGGSVVFRQGSHICIDVLVDSFPAHVQKIVSWIIVAVNVVALGYLCIKGWTYGMQMYHTSRATNILGIPYALIYGIVPVGCVLMIVNQVLSLFKRKEA